MGFLCRYIIHTCSLHRIFYEHKYYAKLQRKYQTDSLQRCESNLASVQTQLEAAKGELDRPFSQETEYAEKSARLKELNILLNMDEKDKELLDFEPDEGDMEPQKNRDKER